MTQPPRERGPQRMKKMILRIGAVIVGSAMIFSILSSVLPRPVIQTTVSARRSGTGAQNASGSSVVSVKSPDDTAGEAVLEAAEAVRISADARTPLTPDDVQYPVIILPGINHSVAYLADENGEPVTDSKGNKLENGLLITDTSNLVTDILSKILFPLIGTLFTGSDMGLSEGVKATIADLFHAQASDPDGMPKNNLVVKEYNYPVSEMDEETKDWFYRMLPVDAYADMVGEDMIYIYTFPLIGDPMASGEKLKSFIDMVKAQKGVDKVNLLSVSLGGTILTSYAEQTGGDWSDINRICGVVSVYDGTTIIDDFFARRWDLDDDFVYTEYLPGVLKENGMNDLQTYLIAAAFALLPKSTRDVILSSAIEGVLDNLLVNCPQFWAMTSSGAYPELAQRYLSDPEHAELRAKTDAFQQARLDLKNNLLEARTQGVVTSTISGCGLTYNDGEYNFFGIVASHDTTNTDAIIPVGSTSLGASSVPAGKTFDNGYLASHDPEYISPDFSVDSSSCLFADNAWFFMGQHHEIGHNDAALKLASYILTGAIKDVYTAPDRFPRFNRARDSKELNRWLIPEAEQVISNADGKYSDEQVAAVRTALDAALAMEDDTICDAAACEKATRDMRLALAAAGVREAPKEESVVSQAMGKGMKALFEALYSIK